MDQLLIKSVIILSLVIILLRFHKSSSMEKADAFRRIFLFLFLAFAMFAVLFPDFVSIFANYLGVGRGTDLITYLLFILFIANAISSSVKRKKLETQVTKLARLEALRSAKSPDHASDFHFE